MSSFPWDFGTLYRLAKPFRVMNEYIENQRSNRLVKSSEKSIENIRTKLLAKRNDYRSYDARGIGRYKWIGYGVPVEINGNMYQLMHGEKWTKYTGDCTDVIRKQLEATDPSGYWRGYGTPLRLQCRERNRYGVLFHRVEKEDKGNYYRLLADEANYRLLAHGTDYRRVGTKCTECKNVKEEL